MNTMDPHSPSASSHKLMQTSTCDRGCRCQVCSLSDLRLHYGLKSREAVQSFAYHSCSQLRTSLIDKVCYELRRRVPHKDREAARALELRITQALSLGDKAKVRILIGAFPRVSCVWYVLRTRHPQHVATVIPKTCPSHAYSWLQKPCFHLTGVAATWHTHLRYARGYLTCYIP
jgi:hypothetical protein